jgi:hypothetical protein
VLVAHADAAFVDAGSDVLAGLVGPAAVDHVIGSPAVFGLGTDGGADEQVELPLALQVVLLNVLGYGDGHDFRVTGRRKAGPAQVHTRLEKLDRLFSGHDLAQK